MSTQLRQRGLERFSAATRALASRLRSQRPLMERIGAYGASSTVRRIDAGIGPDNAPLTQAFKKGSNRTLRDTGQFMQSFTHDAGVDWAAWGTNAKQALLLHEGGTITPKKAKRLAIPAGWRTRRLMRRFGETPRRCVEGMRKGGYNVWTSKSGKAVLARRKTEANRAKPFVLFILKDSVTVPARPYLYLDAADWREVEQLASDFLHRAAPGGS